MSRHESGPRNWLEQKKHLEHPWHMNIWMGDSDRELICEHLSFAGVLARADLYHSHPHLQRMESDSRSFFNSSLQTAHDLIHIALLPDGSVP